MEPPLAPPSFWRRKDEEEGEEEERKEENSPPLRISGFATGEEMQAQTCATMRLCLADQIMYHVMDESSPKKIWDKLAKKFMSKTLTRKLYLKQKLYGLKMQEGSDLAEHVNVFNQLVADLGKVDVKIEDEDMAIVLLCSLPDSSDHLVTTLTYGKEKVQVDDVVSALLSHE